MGIFAALVLVANIVVLHFLDNMRADFLVRSALFLFGAFAIEAARISDVVLVYQKRLERRNNVVEIVFVGLGFQHADNGDRTRDGGL